MGIRESMEVINDFPLSNYYGSLDQSVKPKYGVHYYVLDEYMLRTMDQLTDRAKREFDKMNHSIKKSHVAENKANKEALKTLGTQIKDLEKLIKNVVNENDLKMPKKLEPKK